MPAISTESPITSRRVSLSEAIQQAPLRFSATPKDYKSPAPAPTIYQVGELVLDAKGLPAQQTTNGIDRANLRKDPRQLLVWAYPVTDNQGRAGHGFDFAMTPTPVCGLAWCGPEPKNPASEIEGGTSSGTADAALYLGRAFP